MKITMMMIAASALVLFALGGATPADIPRSQLRNPTALVRIPEVPRKVGFRHRTVMTAYRKTTGMLCVLPPHVIVARNWNGPQCRYVDNIILPYQRLFRIHRLAFVRG